VAGAEIYVGGDDVMKKKKKKSEVEGVWGEKNGRGEREGEGRRRRRRDDTTGRHDGHDG
jgi:hypothetical protein